MNFIFIFISSSDPNLLKIGKTKYKKTLALESLANICDSGTYFSETVLQKSCNSVTKLSRTHYFFSVDLPFYFVTTDCLLGLLASIWNALLFSLHYLCITLFPALSSNSAL